jgi:hypothetical protein
MDDCEDCMPALLVARIASAGNRPERWRAETTAGLIQRWRVGQVEILRAAGILFLGVSLIPPVVASTLVNGRGNDVWRTTLLLGYGMYAILAPEHFPAEDIGRSSKHAQMHEGLDPTSTVWESSLRAACVVFR